MKRNEALMVIAVGALVGLASCRQQLLGASQLDGGGGGMGPPTGGAGTTANGNDAAPKDAAQDTAEAGVDTMSDRPTDLRVADVAAGDSKADVAEASAHDGGPKDVAGSAGAAGTHADAAVTGSAGSSGGAAGTPDASGSAGTGGASSCGNVTIPAPVIDYTFDDCDSSTKLRDKAAVGAVPAQRGLGTRCVPGRDGLGLFFDGSAEARVTSNVGARPDFKLPQVTVAISVRPWRSASAPIVGRWNGANQFLFAFEDFGPRYWFKIGSPNATPTGDYYEVEIAAEDDVWVDLVGVFDNDKVRVYKDGVLAGEAGITLPPRALQQNGYPLTLGYLIEEPPPDPPPPGFRGDVDTLRIWDKALTPAQIARLHCR